MPDPVESSSSNLVISRSPVSILRDCSKRVYLRPTHPDKHSEPPTPISPPQRITRRRVASLNTNTASLPPGIGDLTLSSASSNDPPSSGSTTERVCLCQPDPKIPRPRNAFILYRQHHQAQVIAQHPGLANPEISKIIGEQWRDQAPEVKNDWKRLAEEEKQRHRLQYPGYRYQPRRAGRPHGVRPLSTSSADNPVRCAKCNGRYISTPSTPITPYDRFPPYSGSGLRDISVPYFIPATREFTNMDRSGSSTHLQMPNNTMDSPRAPPPYQQSRRRIPHQRPKPLRTHGEVDEDIDMLSPSPDQKRRRYNDMPYGNNWSSSSPGSNALQRFSRASPMSVAGYKQSLPGPRQMLLQPETISHPPQLPTVPRYPYHQRQGYDESLRLPPLQTQVRSVGTAAETYDSQARGVEAMIMTIPVLNKIKVLKKIAPPLRAPGIANPTLAIRGAVVAIEGSDKPLIMAIGEFITDYLNKDPSCAVKTWTGAQHLIKSTSLPAGTEISETERFSRSPSENESVEDHFLEYLTVISSWHKKSQQIAKHIITPPSEVKSLSLDPVLNSSTVELNDQKQKVLPIALLPAGFSLTTSDDFAKRVPINDEYAPVDHWQWMATLWRGIIGPDVIVYTTRADRADIESAGTVQVIREQFSIILRVPETGKMDEVTARRLGFEVLEMAIKVEEQQKKSSERSGGA